MIGKKINQLATELAPVSTDLTIIGDPISGVSKKITLAQLGAIFSGAVSFYTNLAGFPALGDINVIYCAKDTQKLYLWSGSAYVEVFPSQALLDTYQLRSEKGVSNGYASLDVNGKVPIGQLPNSIMEYKGTWNAATNTPTLVNGTGDTGDVYICSNSGTVNFGAGDITFAVGDYVVYSGSIYQRSSGAVGTVTSVGLSTNGNSITIGSSPVTTSGTISANFVGNSTQYINGAGNLVTFPSTIAQAERLITEVYNSTGATLTKGTIVYINGGQGNLPTVTKALATGDSTSAQTFGVVQADITNNNNGYVVVAGKLSDLDTQAYTEGTQLYLSSTTAGAWTSTKQYAPAHLVYVGIVVRSHPTQGIVEVKIQNGYELDELHDVAAQNPDNNDILQYKTSTSLWTKVAGTTSNIAEGSNLYYTDARSRAALSFTAGSGAYNSTTGVITIPTNTNQLTNGAAFITLGSLSAGAGISYNNTTGVIASTITQYTDAMARASISLTTTGTSGAATYNSTTGVLNVPQYAPDLSGYVPTSRTLTINGTAYDLSANRSWSVGTVTSVGLSSATSGVTIGSTPVTTSGTITLAIATASGSQQGLLSSTDWTTFNNKQNALTNPVTGTGTTNYLPKFTGTSTIGNSDLITDASGNLSIAQGNAPTQALNLYRAGSTQTVMAVGNSNTGLNGTYFGVDANGNGIMNTTGAFANIFSTNGSERMRLDASGNLGLGVTPSAWASNYKAITSQNISLYGRSDDSDRAGILVNGYYDNSLGFVYTNSAFATLYELQNGQHRWWVAPSGTAGNAISFTPAMTLNASGNLLLGTTTDPGYGRTTASIYNSSGGILQVAGSSTTALFYVYQPDNIAVIGTTTNHNFAIHTNGTQKLLIASTGAATFSSSVTAVGLASTGTNHIYNSNELRLYNSNNTNWGTIKGSTDTTNGTISLTGGTGNGMFINNGGSVGIGTTSPKSYASLTTNGMVAALGGVGVSIGESFRINNYYNAGTGTDRTIATGYAASVGLDNANGGMTFNSSSSSVTADNNVTVTERMRITSGGIVQVNTTASIGGGVMNLNGDLRFGGVSGASYSIINYQGGSLNLGTNNTTNLTITSGGNVEIATGSIKTGEPDTGYGRAAFKIGTRQSGTAFDAGGYIPVSIDGTVYFINLFTSTP